MRLTDAEVQAVRATLGQKRTVPVFGDIDEESSSAVIAKLSELGDEKRNESITVMIDSYGGSIYSASAIAAAIESCPNQVNTEVLGKAFSAGFAVFMRGKERTVHGGSFLLAHTVSICTSGYNKVPTVSEQVKRVEKWLDVEVELYARLTKKDEKYWRKILFGKDDVMFTAKEAMALGIATKLV
jgi:ATP-dependent protease ClpP protease subunit